jgi:hypothetical protein
VLAEQTGYLLVQLADLLVRELQLLQCHLQEPSAHGIEVRARAECITQLFRRGSQLLVGQRGHSRWVGFSVSQRRAAMRLVIAIVAKTSASSRAWR